MYAEFFGLSEKPFEDTPDPKFFYLTPRHQEILTSVLEGIERPGGFICLTGGVGTGKTTLVHRLRSLLRDRVETVFIYHAPKKWEDLLREILTAMGVKVKMEKEAFFTEWREYFSRRGVENRPVVVVIDEAQNLSKDALEELGRLPESSQEAQGIRIVFVGQLDFEKKLCLKRFKGFNERIGVRHQLQPFDGVESRGYIDHRLRLAGSSGARIFTPEAVSMIITNSQGIPRLMNVFCDNALFMGFSLSRKEIDVEIVRSVTRNIEGPSAEDGVLTDPPPAAKKESVTGAPRRSFRARILFAVVPLICIGGLILFLRGTLRHRPWATGKIEIKQVHDPRELSLASPVSQAEKAEDSKDEPSGLADSFQPSQRVPSIPDPRETVPEVQKPQEIVVVLQGETISFLVKRHYGISNLTAVDLILESNPEITNAHLIRVRQEVKIPGIEEERLVIRSPDLSYKIHVGTFFAPGFAKMYRDEPSLKGMKIEVQPRAVSPRETWYRVLVGRFKSKEEARGMIDLLRKKGLLPLFEGSRPESS